MEKIKIIANKTVQEITQDDKQYLRDRADEMGIEFNPRPACKACYIDLAIQIYNKLKHAEQGEAELRKWRLKEGVDVIWRGIRINDATITDEKAEQYIKAGFPTIFFEI